MKRKVAFILSGFDSNGMHTLNKDRVQGVVSNVLRRHIPFTLKIRAIIGFRIY